MSYVERLRSEEAEKKEKQDIWKYIQQCDGHVET